MREAQVEPRHLNPADIDAQRLGRHLHSHAPQALSQVWRAGVDPHAAIGQPFEAMGAVARGHRLQAERHADAAQHAGRRCNLPQTPARLFGLVLQSLALYHDQQGRTRHE
jgi:hypothetical protein